MAETASLRTIHSGTTTSIPKDRASMRVVPSGKIYRQMFDAQVQLTQSLTKIKREESMGEFGMERQSTVASIPLVKMRKDELSHGMLTERQLTWADGFPNDPHVENPVLYKQYADYVNTKLKESDSSVAGNEVRGLPDQVVPARSSSDVIERISANRKERHESAVEDMHQELSMINAEIEPRISEASEMLLRHLKEDDEDIQLKLARIEKDEDLLTYSQDGLLELWKEVEGHSTFRQEWITELDQTLTKAEDDRMDAIREVFANYAKTLEKIAHMMPPDLHRFLDRESQLINQTMLSNRRAYSDLYVRLLSSDIEREKTQHTLWKRRVENWKTLYVDHAIKEFGDFMQGERVLNPSEVRYVLDLMMKEQDILNKKRKDLIAQLGEMRPPASTKSSVYQWHKSIQSVSKDLDAVNVEHMNKLHGEYEKVCQECIDKMETIQNSLIESGICTVEKAKRVVELEMLPLIGERQRIYEQNLETMEKALELHNNTTGEQIKSLFKYAQGASHVWDVHEIGLAKQERALQEKLETCRHQHDNQNQDKEAHLDVVMDKMRQDAKEESLKDSLNKALDMLEKIKNAYEVFHQEQTDIVKKYPNMVKQELNNYDETVCKFFMVDRNNPEAGTILPKGRRRRRRQEPVKTEPKQDKKGKKSKEATLPEAVTEILSTEKGTVFYVLTVAGEYGVPPESELEDAKRQATTTFITEDEEAVKPDYVINIDIPANELLEIKKKIRMNFLNHLEEWTDQAMQRADSVVIAKCEELNSELDLRLHLHKPRARRAEYDVHNVRAAELVMHSERVVRHTKGIQQSLNELRQRFTEMTKQHNKLAHKFREDIESLEVIFINATKSSRLLTLQNQLGVELEKFMQVIRTSLREFRQHLDKTLQMLRESNARFVKSFKVFSDGGNFCPEEIEDYRKKLDKQSQKIDMAEGSIMSDLEGMESKRLDQATKVALEFEDRFKSHMIDLVFMEKIARWLTNTQVKIKAEVANSNTQAQTLAQHINDLDRRIDACERPNLDKEQITSRQLNDTLKGIFEAFHARSVYLNCVTDPALRPTSATMQGNPALVTRVAFMPDTTPTPISKAGKQPSEDPSVGVIKSILKTQKSKMRFGLDAELDGEGFYSGSPHQEMREKMKSSMSNTPSEKSKSNRKGGHSGGASEPRRVPSGSEPATSITPARLRRSSKSSKFDKKYMVFGEKDEEGEDKHLLGIIRRTLREALDGLLTSADMYYRAKGNRPVTRPQALQETFEHCAEVIVNKLQSYFTQADEYHNQCLQEFRSQLTQLEHSVEHVPSLLITDILNEEIQKSKTARKQMYEQFSQKLQDLEKQQEEYKRILRPVLGHPHQEDELESLCKKETERHEQYLEAVEEQTTCLQDCTVEHAKMFLEILARTAENQLLQFDNLVVIDEIERGRTEAQKHPTSELIRRRNAGLPLEDDEEKSALPRGKNTWQGIPNNELVVGGISGKVQCTATTTTAKTTLGHSAAVKARDKAYQDYKTQFEKTLQGIDDEKQKLLRAEQRWVDSWNTSVEKIKQLF